MAHVSALLRISLLTLMLTATAQASSFDSDINVAKHAGSESAIIAHHSVIVRLINQDVDSVARDTLDVLVAEGVEALRVEGFVADADRFESEWQNKYRTLFMAIGALGLGDHTPLSQWLATFTDALHERLGDQVFNALHFDDIETMNFALPVVFQPRGDRRNTDTWDKLEYRRHFVPFSGVAAYWGSYAACQYAARTQPMLKMFCKRVAGMVKQVVELRLAPRLSDTIYDRAQGYSPAPVEFDATASAAELRSEFQQIRD